MWDNRISQALARREIDPQAPIDAESLRNAVNPADARRGLTGAIRDLVVAAWASRHRRAWYLHGTPVDEPAAVTAIRAELSLRPEPLPDSVTWNLALERYARWFGATSNDHRTASNLATFTRDAAARIRTTLPDQERLVTQLQQLHRVLDPREDRRLVLGIAIREVLTRLAGSEADRVAFVDILARTTLTGTDTEIGRSISTAADVAASIARTTWQRFGIVRTAATGSESGDLRAQQAQRILDDLTAAVVDQEHNKSLVDAIRFADDARQRWLEDWQPPSPGPTPDPLTPGPDPVPPPPGPTPPPGPVAPVQNARVQITGPGDWSNLRQRIEALLAEYPEHSFEGRLVARDAPGSDRRTR